LQNFFDMHLRRVGIIPEIVDNLFFWASSRFLPNQVLTKIFQKNDIQIDFLHKFIYSL